MGGKYPGADSLLAVRDALVQSGAGSEPVPLLRIQELANAPKTRVRSILTMMKEVGVVRELRASRFRLISTDIPMERLERVAGEYTARQEADRGKLERMSLYAQSAGCRWRLLLEYFDEAEGFDCCGVCDNCVMPLEERLRV